MNEPKMKEKSWNAGIEKELMKLWDKESLNAFNPYSGKKIYSIDDPPPYPSGDPHPGQMAHYAAIDMIARHKRMQGYEVLYPRGYDRNGINIEQVVEKKFRKKMHEFDREEFIKLCKAEIDKIAENIDSIFKRVGLSCDFSSPYSTDSPEYRALSQACFIQLWNKGLIYEDLRPNNYCPGCRTTIAEAEVVYKELPAEMTYVKWKVKETDDVIEIGTTRPELLCACRAVLFNPSDERYAYLEGKHAVLPLYGREVPIIPHSAAKPEFGTGVVMICSYGDTTDIQLFRELKLKPIAAINESNEMTEEAGFLKGMKVKDARKAIIEKLKKENLISKQEQVLHRTPTCERSGDALEFISLKEWYVKQLPYLDDLKKMADEMKFYPEKNKQILINWINSVTIDWPISRRRYYHTEIPLWYCKKCGKPFAPKPGPYYRPWKESPPAGSRCSCGSAEFAGEERVFDTWMDSSVSNLYITGYMRNEELFKKSYPCSMRPQGREIVRTWLFYTMLKNKLLLDSKPFENVWITGLGMDEHGKKLSKSKGNYIEPMPIIEKYGADAWRLWIASETSVGEDFRLSEERIAGAGKFLTKLWNTSRFISSFEHKESGELKSADRWILTELNSLIRECKKGYDEYNYFVPATKTREFVWNVFAPHYLEMAKARAYEGDSGALYTLHACLKTICELMAPIIPFITDKIYRDIYGETVHKKRLPDENASWESSLIELTPKMIEFNSLVWKTKKEKSLPLNAEIEGVKIPTELKPFEDDLVKMHRLR
ncbi:MAG: valine--tRNA ligase [archaeon]